MRLQTPLFVWHQIPVSVRTLFLGFGGLFLITKATQEIHQDLEHLTEKSKRSSTKNKRFWHVVVQIAVMDVIFSLDSVLTAVGLTTLYWVMALAITLSIIILMGLSEIIDRFMRDRPTIKMLALCFLIIIGILLIADGLSYHIPRGYLYFAMAFSLTVELLNNLRKHRKGV
jgi:predicted tellurium resistance membrane protein TerC